MPASLEEQAERLRAEGIAVEVDLRGLDEELPEDVQTVVFRTVQEALTNIHRHSGARNASVVAAASGSRLRIVVEDDGASNPGTCSGTDLPARPGRHPRARGADRRPPARSSRSSGGGTAVVVDLEMPR